MTTVERIKSVCKKIKKPVSKMERDLGYSNGYLNSLTRGDVPGDRLRLIADYLGVPVAYLVDDVEYDTLSVDSARILAMVHCDPKIAEALETYFRLPEDKKKLVVDMIMALECRANY